MSYNINEKSVIEGAISVKSVLERGTRDIFNIWIDKDKINKNINYIVKKAKEQKIKTEIVSSDFFNNKNLGKTYGGIIAEVGQRKFDSHNSLLAEKNPFIILLEGIEDPFNFGCAIRSLYAAGATGLILPERNWMTAAGTVIKASAGASEHIKTAIVSDIKSFLTAAKEKGISIICAERKDAVSLYEQKLDMPLILAIGGEKRGVSKVVFEASDKKIYIPYGREFRNSLSASAAAAVFAFEIYRQRNQ